ncbi:hypothetical protein ABZ814_07045 [Micromonospora musae]|uniref:hypothetical protein n=1 Tax=Micromonospora musae TaxID=1894970 RepID=UPI0033D6FDCA
MNAERHYRGGEDFDRRVALIGYDNAIEVAITTYLSLHPIQRGERTYSRDDCTRWLLNYHTKLDFLEQECQTRGISMLCGKDEMVWYHALRNGQYHGGGATVPQARELDGIRRAAIHVFSVLFDEANAESLVEERCEELSVHNLPQRNDQYDRLIDGRFGTVELAGNEYYTSELLYSWDPVAYSELGAEIASEKKDRLDSHQ